MENTWDLVENKIKIDNAFKIDVIDFINTIYKTRKKSILPYDINVEDVFEMLQDLVWANEDKFVVFFNFEFVMCLMQLGITPNRITYIAPSNESYYAVRDCGWGELGMKSILFDLSIYNKYKSRNQWKKHLMKKINKINEFIAVGNIPFTINSTDSSNSKKIGNDFIGLMNKFKKACYILPAKFDSKTFKNELILNPSLTKIVFHKRKIFNISDLIYTCHVITNNESNSDEFIFTDNTTKEFIKLKKSKNTILSKNFNESFISNEQGSKLSDLWNRGNKHLNEITKTGEYKVITSLGDSKTNDFKYELDETETTGLGKWKVVMPNMRCKSFKLAGPEFALSYSIIGFLVDTKEQAESLYKYFEDIDIIDMTNKLATSGANTKTLFSKIPLPHGII
jgi:hypothetical protein